MLVLSVDFIFQIVFDVTRHHNDRLSLIKKKHSFQDIHQ